MGKWTIGLILVALSCVPIFLARYSDPGMLDDSDTRVLLSALEKRQDPLSWFTGDWPLENHFYRPISTLFFELDYLLYGMNAAGYGLTNALLCIACVLLLFWFLRELTDRVEIAVPGAVLFAAWHLNVAGTIATLFAWAALLVFGLLLLKQRSWTNVLLAALVLLFLSYELPGMQPLQDRMLGWLPSRTASVMTVFALLSLAAYCRYERTSAQRSPEPDPTPLDPPATKGTVLRLKEPRAPWSWVLVSLAGLLLALGSYEQAVILPGLLFGAALCLRLQRYRVRWTLQGAFWGLLVGYLALRANLVPSDVSGYQAQQFRSGPGVWMSLLSYLFPAGPGLWTSLVAYDVPLLFGSGGLVGLIYAFPFGALASFASNVGVFIAARRQWLFPLTALAMSFVAFLPMAWLKHFVHYHYLPMALRAFFVAAIFIVAGKALVSAASRPALQAPPRLGPAPGSLPHP